MTMNEKKNILAEINFMLGSLSDAQLVAVNNLIAAFGGGVTNDVVVPEPEQPATANAPTASEPAPAPTPEKPAKKATKKLKAALSEKQSAPEKTASEPVSEAPKTTTSVSVDDYADYKCANFDATDYRKVASILGCATKKGGAMKSCRGLCYAVMDSKVDIDSAKDAVVRFKASKGWA